MIHSARLREPLSCAKAKPCERNPFSEVVHNLARTKPAIPRPLQHSTPCRYCTTVYPDTFKGERMGRGQALVVHSQEYKPQSSINAPAAKPSFMIICSFDPNSPVPPFQGLLCFMRKRGLPRYDAQCLRRTEPMKLESFHACGTQSDGYTLVSRDES